MMIFSKKALMIIPMLFISILSISAQPGGGRGGRGGNPEEMAEKQTQMMTDSLMLSSAQTEKVGEVNLKFAKQMMEMRASANGDWMGMREKMVTLREENSTELAKYLTVDQMEKWIAVNESMSKGSGDRGQRDGKKGEKRKGKKKSPPNQ